MPFRVCLQIAGLASVLALCTAGCNSVRHARIAVIPQTEGTLLWEAAHVGAEVAADQTGTFIYWNAPTREDDVEAQIALVDRVINGNYQGLVLAPDQALSLISPVRRALARGIPTVIIGSPLPIPAGGNLSYILNDEVEGGRLAAQRVAALLHGHGTVAILGINPDVTGTMLCERAFEQALVQSSPGTRIVERRMGSFNVPHEQQVVEDTLKTHPDLDIVIALMSTTVDGALSVLDATPDRRAIKVIGFDIAGLAPFDRNANLDCVIQEDARTMGQKAVELIHARLLGQSVPALEYIHPTLITRENYNSPEVRQMLSQDWTLGHWRWSSIQ